MKGFSISTFLFLVGFVGTAHAENVYDMGYQGYLIKQAEGPNSYFDPVPVSEISNDQLTFSGNAMLQINQATFDCCQLNLGNQGSFTVAFANPVNSVGLNIFPIAPGSPSVLEQLDRSTVSAIYRNSEGEVVGQRSVTADWLGDVYGPWHWNNTFNGHESAFGVSGVGNFSEITFSVDGMGATFNAKGFSYAGALSIGSANLYYSYANPVPEPETYAMLLSGLSLLGFLAKRRKKPGRDTAMQ